jgi:hypothetical protein
MRMYDPLKELRRKRRFLKVAVQAAKKLSASLATSVYEDRLNKQIIDDAIEGAEAALLSGSINVLIETWSLCWVCHAAYAYQVLKDPDNLGLKRALKFLAGSQEEMRFLLDASFKPMKKGPCSICGQIGYVVDAQSIRACLYCKAGYEIIS